MKRKTALRPIARPSRGDARSLEPVEKAPRAYPDARALAAALQDAVRALAIPAIGLYAGCSAELATPLPITPLLPADIGQIVEGLRAPIPATEIVPLNPERPVEVSSPPPTELLPVPQTLPVQGRPPAVEVVPVEVTPPPPRPPPVDRDPPALRGRVSNVRPHPVPVPGGIRPAVPLSRAEPSPVPRTLSDEALHRALASIGERRA